MPHRRRTAVYTLAAFAMGLLGFTALAVWQPTAALFLALAAYGAGAWIVRRRRGLTLLALGIAAWRTARHYRRNRSPE